MESWMRNTDLYMGVKWDLWANVILSHHWRQQNPVWLCVPGAGGLSPAELLHHRVRDWKQAEDSVCPTQTNTWCPQDIVTKRICASERWLLYSFLFSPFQTGSMMTAARGVTELRAFNRQPSINVIYNVGLFSLGFFFVFFKQIFLITC